MQMCSNVEGKRSFLAIPRAFLSGAGLKGTCLCKGRGGETKSRLSTVHFKKGGKAALSLGGSFVKEMDAASGAQRKRKGGGGVRRTGTGFNQEMTTYSKTQFTFL